jgi:hypothetical protein
VVFENCFDYVRTLITPAEFRYYTTGINESSAMNEDFVPLPLSHCHCLFCLLIPHLLLLFLLFLDFFLTHLSWIRIDWQLSSPIGFSLLRVGRISHKGVSISHPLNDMVMVLEIRALDPFLIIVCEVSFYRG